MRSRDIEKWPVPTYGSAAAAIGVPLDRWAGQCHGISGAIIDAGLAPEGAHLRRGYWLGDCAEGAYFRSNFAQHSWIELPGGGVCDPTGFAFQLGNSGSPIFATPELGEPLATFPHDIAAVLYDIGGCRMFAKAAGDAPNPATIYEVDDPIMLDGGASAYIADLLGQESSWWGDQYIEVTHEQAMWLANLPILDHEGRRCLSRFFAAEVYEMLVNAGCKAYIPIDRLDWILPEAVTAKGVRHA